MQISKQEVPSDHFKQKDFLKYIFFRSEGFPEEGTFS